MFELIDRFFVEKVGRIERKNAFFDITKRIDLDLFASKEITSDIAISSMIAKVRFSLGSPFFYLNEFWQCGKHCNCILPGWQ